LFFDGCGGHEHLLPALRLLAATHVAELQLRRIQSDEPAQRERFPRLSQRQS
jgi:hypothetical protein